MEEVLTAQQRAELHAREQDAADAGAPEANAPGPADPPTHRVALSFDGDPAEYFRLWVVHMLLNVLTLGLYSPWAKVRKARWFAQHTQLLGDRFDYHGRPFPILTGRLIALALLIAWSLAFDFSGTLGLLVFGMLCVAGPMLFANAQRFRLANTSWRGLRFGFHVGRGELYAVCIPALLAWTIGTVLNALGAPAGAIALASAAGGLTIPYAHARLKLMQHSRSRFARHTFAFDAATGPFYRLYLKAGFIVMGAGLIAGLAAAGLAGALRVGGTSPVVVVLLSGAVTVAVVWMFAWPFFAARLQDIVWSRTSWATVRFCGEMKASRMIAIVVPRALLTLATFGLAWPFLAVAVARYRVESIALISRTPLEDLRLLGDEHVDAAAVGDAAADFFGLDLGW